MSKPYPPPPDQPQRDLITGELGRSMLVEAAAGTGKTTSMVDRMIALIEQGKCGVGELAAVTFTRKAAAELRGRFQIALEKRARTAAGAAQRRVADAVGRVEQCFVGTIHSFCGRLLRERPVEAGVDVAFSELEDDADARLRQQAWDEHVATLHATEAPILAELDTLGLGIGQLAQTFIHHYADYPDVDEWPTPPAPRPDVEGAAEALADYVADMEDLLPIFPPDPGTDNLMPRYRRVVLMARQVDFRRMAELASVLQACNASDGITMKYWPDCHLARAERGRWNEFRELIVVPFLTALRACRYEPALRAIRPAVDIYDRLRAAAGALNFNDLLLRAARLLREQPHVRRYFRKRFTHLLVDEFQDTDPLQAEVMMLLTATDAAERHWRACQPVPGSLFVVGDPKQSIYRFRRADIVTYNQVKDIIEATGGLVVQLSANFRCVKPIVDWVNGAFAPAFPAEATPQSPEYVALQVGRTEPPADGCPGVVRLDVPDEYGNQDVIADYEADFIARTIRRRVDGGASPGDFLIIARVKARLSVYARALQKLGVPHQVTGGTALNELAELRLLRTCLAAVVQPQNPVALVAALRSPLFGISDPALYAFRRAGGEFAFQSAVPETLGEAVRELFVEAFERLCTYDRWLGALPPVTAIEKVATDVGLPVLACSAPGGDVQAGSLGKAIELLRTAYRSMWTAAELLEHLGQLVEREQAYDGIPARHRRTPVVRLMNLHKVKGLEAPAVFLADPSGESEHAVQLHIDRSGDTARGYLAVFGERRGKGAPPLLAHPPGWDALAVAEGEFEEAEKKRLLYVAATRARDQLVVSQRANSNKSNPWGFFAGHLDDPPLSDPGEQAPPKGEVVTLTTHDVQEARARIRTRWTETSRPTYAVGAAKQLSVEKVPFRPGSGSRSTISPEPARGEAVRNSTRLVRGLERRSYSSRLITTTASSPRLVITWGP